MDELPRKPAGVGLDPPGPVFLVSPDNVVITEPVFELGATVRAAIPNPWSKTEEYVIGIVRGTDGLFVLEFEESIGKLELHAQGWVCTGLARTSVIAAGLSMLAENESKPFTERLLKRAAKGKKKKRSK